MSKLPRLVVILGPTASGKSALGIALAQRLGGEVLVCDSTQVYRHFDIGTAKVPVAEQEGIRHHLVDLVEPTQVFTAGDYRRCALAMLEDVARRAKLPVLTAGTGLYLRALLEGLADVPTRSEKLRERLRKMVEARGPDHLHRVLTRLDRESARRIARQDAQKVIRAIEIRILAGKPLSEVHRGGREPLKGYEVIKIGLQPPRQALYDRIDERAEAMVADGWLDEVRRLVATGIRGDAKPFQFIGYLQLRSHLEGRISIDQAVQQIQQATRNFARRQITWFRKEPGVTWLAEFGGSPQALAEALARIEA